MSFHRCRWFEAESRSRQDTRPSGIISSTRWAGSEGTYVADVGVQRHGGLLLSRMNRRDFILEAEALCDEISLEGESKRMVSASFRLVITAEY